MKIAIGKEQRADEKRVAASPETVKKLIALGAEVFVEEGAGEFAAVSDAAFSAAGATILPANDIYSDADIVLRVQNAEADDVSNMKQGAILVGMLSPYQETDLLQSYANNNVTAFSMEFVPRITRAQSMDVLSSQANLAGYRAVLEAANAFGRGFPLMMTAAGTVPPAKAFIMGAGVAGLQAIATARRLGAQVSATDVRMAAKEQVESLGASFVMVESEETKDAETSGGYAKEMSDEYKKQQAELIAATIKKQDIVITTALIPGRKAPLLVTEEMIASMRPGSVIVDMAVSQGGNVALSKLDEVVDVNGVKIVGYGNIPSRISVSASALYARNLYNFLVPMIDTENKAININWEDEIISASALTHDGKIIHPNFIKDA